METVIQKSGRRWVVVRPSLLVDGESVGLKKVRTSTEGGEGERYGKGKDGEVAIGYTIRRQDVGLCIFEECVKGNGKGGGERWGKWEGKMVTLTY